MTKVRVAGFSISLDGFGAGPEQSLENPLGKRGRELHQWFFGTRTFRAMTGEGGGSSGGIRGRIHESIKVVDAANFDPASHQIERADDFVAIFSQIGDGRY